uniref:RFX-type winged-helix domain-containing protein n=2 Tax=Rhodnius prolixus TaxID=13249 RepID=T1I669_RHOPR
MKQVYPNIRPRRLGTRGNSRYCYAGMANRQPQLPVPVLPQINGKDNIEESPVCKWASNILGASFQSISQLEKHIIENKLISEDSSTNDSSFIQSCKISKQTESRKSLDADKRKVEEDSNSTTQTPPERCKGKKVRKGSAGSATKKSPLEESSNSSEAKKPRVPSSPNVTTSKLKITDLPPIPPLKRLKSVQLKSTTGGHETEFLENGNSLEQEEELLKYFQRPSSDDEPKVSQLRMLLERSKTDDKTARRRVSFEVVPESPNSQKKFSFVPISPISNSPFISPKNISSPQRVLLRSSSVNSSCSKNTTSVKKEIPLLQNMMQSKFENSGPSETCRSQSVPTAAQFPQITPVPSEPTDFDINTDTDSSNLLVMDDSSSSLMIDSTINNDNLNQILNIINEIDISKLSRSYPNTPTYTHDPIVGGLSTDPCKAIPDTLTLDIQQRDDDVHVNLFDDCSGLNLYCEGDALNNLAREVGRLDADVL